MAAIEHTRSNYDKDELRPKGKFFTESGPEAIKLSEHLACNDPNINMPNASRFSPMNMPDSAIQA